MIEEGRLGDFVARKVNLDDFLKPFDDFGYTILDETKDKLASNHGLWTEDNKLITEKVTILKGRDSKTLVLGADFDFNPEEYEQITLQLQEGAAAKARVIELEAQLHGTEEKVGGKKQELETLTQKHTATQSQINTLGTQKATLTTAVTGLESQKADLEKYIKDNTPKKAALETDIAGLKQTKKEEGEALERFRVADKSERAEIEQGYELREQELEADLAEIEGQIAERKAELAKAEQADAETPAEPPKEEALVDIKQTPEYQELQALYQDREFAVKKMLTTLLTELPEIDPETKLDKRILTDFYGALERLKEAAAQTGLSEQAEQLLSNLSDTVADVPTPEEMADSAFMEQYVIAVRNCAFELYSIAASRDAGVMYFVLSEMVNNAYDDGDKAGAEKLALQARNLCKEKLPDKLKEAEEALEFYQSENHE